MIDLDSMAVDEPIEIVIDTLESDRNGKWVLCAWRTEHGLVGHSLTRSGHGMGNALSSLGGRGVMPNFPNKAVPGWQAEVLAFAKAGYGTVESIR